ncbi:MAG: CocE/NonD family hydrolase [Ferruginibacter sp.]|nr:CocE/NonD family hydrolase [Cytophagales bacterium]
MFLGFSLLGLVSQVRAQEALRQQDSLYIRENYTKLERQISVRDGVKLFTSVYIPKNTSRQYPILLNRTPYGVAPYGEDKFKTSLGPSRLFIREGYIFVYQDVRGLWMSEGQFVFVRPHIANPKKQEIDESTDTYDTIEWLLKNVPNNNGKVGTWGISAPGFYATASIIDAHPALKAVSPQAPVTEWFLGDDRHHNGAFFLMATFAGFSMNYGHPHPAPTNVRPPAFAAYGTPDAYQFFLKMGPLSNFEKQIFKGGNTVWPSLMAHETYDEFWRSRTPLPHLKNVKPAVLTVGGWFDQEDLYGPLKTYDSIGHKNPKATHHLVMGPWFHGSWSRTDGDYFGNIPTGSKTAAFYQEAIELPFFNHHLKGQADPQLPNAYIFETGSNQWKKYDQWPPKGSTEKRIYLRPGGKLAFEPPTGSQSSHDEYVSDPNKPVPYTAEVRITRGSEFMVEDQRFAARRPDVLVYESEPLTDDLTISGNVSADLFVSTTGTDADFVAKLIDVYPDDAPDDGRSPAVKMGGYQLLVRGEVMRAKFRKSFSRPEALIPNEVSEVKFDMQDAAHTFRKGHKLMVQVQSSWFPLVDRNPQQFLNIRQATEADFRKATHRVHFSASQPSHVRVRVLAK